MAWYPKALAAVLLMFVATPSLAQSTPDNWDGLIRVKSEKIELVYLAPEADFRAYSKVMLDPSEMAVRKNWLRDQRSNSGLGNRVTERDVVRALDAGKKRFDKLFAEAFAKAGYAIATEPGSDVLRVATGVVDIDVVAPDNSTSRSRSYSREAGSATLVVEVRDSVSGAILGRAVEGRLIGDYGPFLRSSSSNRSDFDGQFKKWAETSAEGLNELKALSPVDVNGARIRP